jgi:hypothetical protein
MLMVGWLLQVLQEELLGLVQKLQVVLHLEVFLQARQSGLPQSHLIDLWLLVPSAFSGLSLGHSSGP